jgi:hypothetical protein
MATPRPRVVAGPTDYEHHVMPGQPAAGNHVSHADDRRLSVDLAAHEKRAQH